MKMTKKEFLDAINEIVDTTYTMDDGTRKRMKKRISYFVGTCDFSTEEAEFNWSVLEKIANDNQYFFWLLLALGAVSGWSNSNSQPINHYKNCSIVHNYGPEEETVEQSIEVDEDEKSCASTIAATVRDIIDTAGTRTSFYIPSKLKNELVDGISAYIITLL